MAGLNSSFTDPSRGPFANTYKLSTPEPKPKPRPPKKYRKIMCNHLISRALCREEDIIQLCPTCLIERHILEIHKIQKFLEDRGGIYQSRAKLDEDGTFTTHKMHIHRWRKIKIRCMRDIAVLERMVEESDKDIWNVEEALLLWSAEMNSLFEVPGYKYIDDKRKCEGDEQETMGDDNDAEWQIVPHRKSHKHARIFETSPVTPPPRFTLRISSSYEVLASATTAPRSALKRPSQTAMPSPHPCILAFDEAVTVVPADSKKKTFTSPHNKHTDKGDARSRKEFWRPSESYEPKTWASRKDKEKVDTSGWRLSWEDFRKGKSNKSQKPAAQETKRVPIEGESDR